MKAVSRGYSLLLIGLDMWIGRYINSKFLDVHSTSFFHMEQFGTKFITWKCIMDDILNIYRRDHQNSIVMHFTPSPSNSVYPRSYTTRAMI